MSQRKPKANRHSPNRARAVGEASPPRLLRAFGPSPARTETAQARLSDALAPALVAAASSPEREGPAAEVRPQDERVDQGRRDGTLSATQAEEVGRIVQALRDEVRALGQRLDSRRDVVVARPAAAEAVSTAAPEEAPRATGPGDEPPAARPEPAPSPVPRPPSGVAEGAGLPGQRRANSQPLRCRLRNLEVIAPDGSRATRVLSAHMPFEMRLALDLSRDSNPVGSPVLCEVSVRARRLGGGETSILGQASQNIASATKTVSLWSKGLALAEGLFRLEATAEVRGPGETRGAAFFNGGLIRVL